MVRKAWQVVLWLVVMSLTLWLYQDEVQADGVQWKSLGPDGGEIQVLAIDPKNPQTLYAGTFGGGVFKSVDGGGHWQPINKGLGDQLLDVQVLAVDPQTPQTLYLGTGGGLALPRLFKSTDGGQNWGLISEDLPSIAVIDIAIDPVTPQTIYIVSNETVHKSIDGGEDWQGAIQGLPVNTSFIDLLMDTQTPQTLYLRTGLGLYKTIDGAAQWVPADQELLHTDLLAIDPQNSQIMYGRNGGRLSKSVNGGASWIPADAGLPETGYVGLLAIDPQTSQTLYAITEASILPPHGSLGIFKSTNGGASWQPVSAGLPAVVPPVDPPQFLQIETLILNPQNPQILYLSINDSSDSLNNGGIYKSLNGGALWQPSRQGLRNIMINELIVDPLTPQTFYVTTYGRASFRTHDGGRNWQLLNSNFPGSIDKLVINPQAPQILYGSGINNILKSLDGGATWTPAQTGLPGDRRVTSLAIDPQRPDRLYAATSYLQDFKNGGVFKSINGGGHWQRVDHDLPADIYVTALVIDPGAPETLYLTTDNFNPSSGSGGAGIFKSTNGGSDWTPINNGLPAPEPPTSMPYTPVNILVINPHQPQTLYAGLGEGGFGGVYKSQDGGLSWNPAQKGLPSNAVTTLIIDPHQPQTLYAAMFDDRNGYGNVGVYKSTDGGKSWAPINTGLTHRAINALAVDPVQPQRLYAGTVGGGVFVLQQPVSYWFPVLWRSCAGARC